jgi:hypothetical protein
MGDLSSAAQTFIDLLWSHIHERVLTMVFPHRVMHEAGGSDAIQLDLDELANVNVEGKEDLDIVVWSADDSAWVAGSLEDVYLGGSGIELTVDDDSSPDTGHTAMPVDILHFHGVHKVDTSAYIVDPPNSRYRALVNGVTVDDNALQDGLSHTSIANVNAISFPFGTVNSITKANGEAVAVVGADGTLGAGGGSKHQACLTLMLPADAVPPGPTNLYKVGNTGTARSITAMSIDSDGQVEGDAKGWGHFNATGGNTGFVPVSATWGYEEELTVSNINMASNSKATWLVVNWLVS